MSGSQAGISIGYKDEDLLKCQQIDGDSDKSEMDVDRLMDVVKVLKHEMLSIGNCSKNTRDSTDKN